MAERQRLALHRQLEDYVPLNEEDAGHRDRAAEFFNNTDRCFERSNEAGHFCGSAFVLSADLKRTLLIDHIKLGRLVQLGGHADGDSDLQAVALKEAQEESGVELFEFLSNEVFDIDVHRIPAYKDIAEHTHYDVRFLLRMINSTDEKRVCVPSDEGNGLLWVDLAEAQKMFAGEPSMERMVLKWAALLE